MIELKHRQDADDLAAKLNKLIDSLTVKALASNLLLAYKEDGNKPTAGASMPDLQSSSHQKKDKKEEKQGEKNPLNAKDSAQSAPPKESDSLEKLRDLVRLLDQENPDRTIVTRLYNNRDASKIAKALDSTAQPVGDDMLIVPESSGIPQRIASLDLPRPEVTLNLWSVELSSHKAEDIIPAELAVSQSLTVENELIRKAIEDAWTTLTCCVPKTGDVKVVFDSVFYDYVSNRYLACASDGTKNWQVPTNAKPELCGKPEQRTEWEACATDKYCLGYTEAFIVSKPSLSRMIFLLAAMKDPQSKIGPVVNSMKLTPNQGKTPTGCPAGGKLESVQAEETDFPNFRSRLTEALSENRVRVLRAAIVDFLFNYKRSVQYPSQFIAYDLSHSADKLDSLFAPIVEGFNLDVQTHLSKVLQQIPCTTPEISEKGVTFSDSGVVTVTATSSNKATVNITTANRFDTTPSFTISQYLTQLQKVESNLPQTALVSLHKDELAAFTALLSTQQPSATHIGRHFNLDITPSSLATASSVDLDISLDVGEDANASNPSGAGDQGSGKQGGSSDDNPSRVVTHTVKDRVRVETTRLFEVSSFSAALRREKGKFIVPILGEIPIFGPMFRFHNPFSSPTEAVFHHTLAVVHAELYPQRLTSHMACASTMTGSLRQWQSELGKRVLLTL